MPFLIMYQNSSTAWSTSGQVLDLPNADMKIPKVANVVTFETWIPIDGKYASDKKYD